MTFRPKALRFLRDLRRNNVKAWFEAHRSEYERDIRVVRAPRPTTTRRSGPGTQRAIN